MWELCSQNRRVRPNRETWQVCIKYLDCFILVYRLAKISVAIGYSVEEVSSGDERYLCAYHEEQVSSVVITMTCSARTYGRYIRLTAADINDQLRLLEVEIYGW